MVAKQPEPNFKKKIFCRALEIQHKIFAKRVDKKDLYVKVKRTKVAGSRNLAQEY